MDKIIVAIVGLAGIFFTYWFFLMKKDEVVSASGEVDIIVKGGYNPNVISVPVGQPTTLNFFLKDPSSCLEEVVIPEFKVRRFLPMDKKTPITITPNTKGQFEIVCGMNMFHGKLIVT